MAITGVKAIAEGRAPGPTVAILAEMDALIDYEHPFANPEIGAAHCCGHNAQVASVLGVAIGLTESAAMAVGAKACIKTVPGYLPGLYDPQLSALPERNGVSLLGEGGFQRRGGCLPHNAASPGLRSRVGR